MLAPQEQTFLKFLKSINQSHLVQKSPNLPHKPFHRFSRVSGAFWEISTVMLILTDSARGKVGTGINPEEGGRRYQGSCAGISSHLSMSHAEAD